MTTGIRSPFLSATPAALSPAEQRAAMRRDKAIYMVKMSKFLLACYVLLMFKPVMPVFADMMAHTFWEKQHILMVHEVNGQFHIHQQLGKAGHQNDTEKSSELKYEVQQYVNVPVSIFRSFVHTIQQGTYLSYIIHSIISPYTAIATPPPDHGHQDKVSGAACDGSWFRA